MGSVARFRFASGMNETLTVIEELRSAWVIST